ncbi:MAG: hypothetical protein JNL21_01690 [Myxococcales bacterium]|nr:hypothetical protein [Myxococcales bacterium]
MTFTLSYDGGPESIKVLWFISRARLVEGSSAQRSALQTPVTSAATIAFSDGAALRFTTGEIVVVYTKRPGASASEVVVTITQNDSSPRGTVPVVLASVSCEMLAATSGVIVVPFRT